MHCIAFKWICQYFFTIHLECYFPLWYYSSKWGVVLVSELDMKGIGKNIRILRQNHKMTQKQLAEATGLATITIQQYERGIREPRFDNLTRIASSKCFSHSFYYSRAWGSKWWGSRKDQESCSLKRSPTSQWATAEKKSRRPRTFWAPDWYK